GDHEGVHGGEVGSAQLARRVDLGKEDLAGRPLKRPPAFDTALKSAKLSVCEAAGVKALKVLEESLGLKGRAFGKKSLNLGPDVLERVRAGAPGVGAPRLAR